ncbi:MAG TPA: lamin tail domain-containing protein [Ilumatobacter sp.]|nr:lamin tail domain-containing protein [Ilumatobacter sp.]
MLFESTPVRRAGSAGIAATVTISLAFVASAPVSAWDEIPTGDETGDIVITELFVDPDAVPDSRGEFIELHNPTNRSIDLAGWTIGDEQYDQYEIRSLRIEPGGLAVLARFGEYERNGGIVADEVYGDAIVLLNSGDRVILRDGDGALVDFVDFSTGGWSTAAGRSLALDDDAADNSDPRSWCLSTTTLRDGDLASPGRPNTCSWSSSQVVISEVMNNPRATSDFVGEWFELTNVGASPAALHGFTIQDERGESFRVETPLVVGAGDRVVFGVTDDPTLNGGVEVDHVYGDAMRLFDADDELLINDADGVLVDRVRWDDGLTFPDPNGASMVLADPALDNEDGSNWCTATVRWADGDLGTPGEPDGCAIERAPDVVITEIMFDPEHAESERSGEWFELSNVGEHPAVLDGYRLRSYFTGHVIDALTIEPGGVAVLAAEGDPSLNGAVPADYVYGTSLPLYNITSRLEIVSPDGRLVDRVRWSSDRGFPHEPGSSIELRSIDVDNALGANWCLGEALFGPGEEGDLGTPGVPGSCPEPEPVVPLRISEVMRRPAAVADAEGEWVELHNPTAEPIDLRNWTVTDDGSDFFRVRTSATVPAGGVVVVARNGDPVINGGVEADIVTGAAMVLLNDRDSVRVTDQYGRQVDRVAWDTSGVMPAPRGASMALAPDGISWCVTATQYGAGDRGTPGGTNDCTPLDRGAIVINEIHRDPAAVVDARGEWIELHNRSTTPVDISGWTLRDDRSNTFRFDAEAPLVIDPGGYLVAGRNGPVLNGGVEVDAVYGVEIHLDNGSDELTLLDRSLRVVDRVVWTETNGFPLVPGASMALRAPDLDGAIGANWCASVTDQGNGDLGTPGSTNACDLVDDQPGDLPTTPTHAVFAVGSDECPAELVVDAASIRIAGDVRSNHDVGIQGSSIVVDGVVSHGAAANVGSGATVAGGIVHEPDPERPTFGWAVDDFRDGGHWVERLGGDIHVHEGGLRIDGNRAELAPGVHVVDGDVSIQTNQVRLERVSIIATGTISIDSNTLDLTPFSNELPTLLAAGGGCRASAVRLGAEVIWITGSVMALNGDVRLDASKISTSDAALVGSSVKVGASRVVLGLSSTRVAGSA